MRKRALKKTLADRDQQIERLQAEVASIEASRAEIIEHRDRMENGYFDSLRTERWKAEHKQARLEAADEFMWGLMILMSVGGFETLDMTTEEGRDTRKWFGNQMEPWLDNAYAPWEDDEDAD